MQSVLILLLFLASVALAQQQSGAPLYSWAGTTEGSPTWFQPDEDTPTNCIPTTGTGNQSPYVVVNFTVPTTSVYEILLLSDTETPSTEFGDPEVFLYSGSFSTSTPCGGGTSTYIRELNQENGNDLQFGPQIDDFVTLQSGTTYYIVVTGDDSEQFGKFALHVYASLLTGSTKSNNTWSVPYVDEGDGTCNNGSGSAPYVKLTLTPQVTGFYDITVGIDANSSAIIDYFYVILYNGIVSDADLTGSTPCTPSVGTIYAGYYADYRGLILFGLTGTAGQSYTLVFSGDDASSIFNYGVQVTPTRVYNYTNTPSFAQPDYGGDTACTGSDNTASNWFAKSFVATGPVVLVAVIQDFEPTYTYTPLDSLSFIYAGVNTASPPATCTAAGISAYYGGWDNTIPAINAVNGSTYTLVSSAYDGDDTSPLGTAGIVYILSGQYVGFYNASATTTTTTTTTTTSTATTATSSNPTITTSSNPTTATSSTPVTTATTATTSTPTTSNTTTSHPTTTTNSTGVHTTTSDMSTVAISFVVLAVSFVAML